MDATTTMLPVLRPDLELLPGPPEPDGAPTGVLHDPLRQTYDRATWWQLEILRRLQTPVSLEAMMRRLRATVPLALSAEYVLRFCQDLVNRGLTVRTGVRDPERLEAEAATRRRHPLVWLLHHYLYIRLPLLRPDRFLTRTVCWARWLCSPVAVCLYCLCGGLGITALTQRWEQYLTTFPRFFSSSGVLAYALAILAVKAVHEFAHAYAAKDAGCRVPSMGIAFLVFCPVPYSDVTDSWRLPRRSARLRISLAGVLAELAVAAVALLGWVLAPAGVLKSLCFVVSSTSLLSSLLVNINPAMRFDGYYILSDLLGIDNLRPRAFALTRWWARTALLGFGLPRPEWRLSRRRMLGMILYSLYAWVYRFFLYLGIALVVYHAFFKLAGVMLFLVEIGYFLIRPLVQEVCALVGLRNAFALRWRNALVLLGLGMGLAWVILPLPRQRSMVAMTVPAQTQVVRALRAGRVCEVRVRVGDRVASGQVLARIEDVRLSHDAAAVAVEIERVQEVMRVRAQEPGARAWLPELHEELERLRAEQQALAQTQEANTVRAACVGELVAWDETLRPGMHVSTAQRLGRIVGQGRVGVRCLIPEDLVKDVSPGTRVRFATWVHPAPCTARVSAISPVPVSGSRGDRLRLLTGQVSLEPRAPARDEPSTPRLFEAWVEFSAGSASPYRGGETGRVWLSTAPRSLLMDWMRYGYGILMRESGF